MKLATIQTASLERVAVVLKDRCAVLRDPAFPTTMLEWILGGKALLDRARLAIAQKAYEDLSLSGVKVLAPLANPGKIVAIGLNYMDHCREQNVPVPDRPIVFTKFTTSIIGPGEELRWDPALTSEVDYEVELGVIIGKVARHVAETEALDHVYGYTVVNDVSARDLQFSDRQWVRAKSLDTFCPMGPVILTADEVEDPQDLALKTTVNRRVLQDSSTKEMIFGVAQLISFLSRSFTLNPGDIIATGTPDGVGVFRDPKVFLQHGDSVVVEVERIGRLENQVNLK